MPPEKIRDEDIVSRSIYRPKDYLPDNLVFLDLHRSFTFQSANNYCDSINCHRLVGNDVQRLHALGIQKQDNDNARLVSQGRPPEREYTGFVPAVTGKIRKDARAEDIHFDVEHLPEKGNNAHCHLQMRFTGEKPHRNRRNTAITRLCDCFDALVAATV